MRSTVRRLLLLGAVAAASLLGATPASAGMVSCPSCVGDGPSSVLISNPVANSAATLPGSHADHRALVEALESGRPAAPGFRPDDHGSEPIYITWLVNDATWDLDLVRVGSDGELWVQPGTKTGDGRGEPRWGWGAGTWHAASDPAAVRDVLERAGVLSPSASSDADSVAASSSDEKASVAAGSPDDSAGVLTGWWWLLPGAAFGIALGLGARPLATEVARRREPGPRQQLIG